MRKVRLYRCGGQKARWTKGIREGKESVCDDMKIGLEFLNLQSRRLWAFVYVEKPLGCLRRIP